MAKLLGILLFLLSLFMFQLLSGDISQARSPTPKYLGHPGKVSGESLVKHTDQMRLMTIPLALAVKLCSNDSHHDQTVLIRI